MRLLVLIIGLALAGAVKAQDMKPLTPEERRVIVDKGYRSAFFGPLLQASRRGLPLPPVRCAVVPFAGQVRRRVRLAEFRRRNPRCREAHDGCRRPAYRNHLCPLRRTPGTCLYGRRLYAQKYAPLRQLRLARVRTRREASSGSETAVKPAVSSPESEGRAASQPEKRTPPQPGTQSGNPGAQASGADATSAAARPGTGYRPQGRPRSVARRRSLPEGVSGAWNICFRKCPES